MPLARIAAVSVVLVAVSALPSNAQDGSTTSSSEPTTSTTAPPATDSTTTSSAAETTAPTAAPTTAGEASSTTSIGSSTTLSAEDREQRAKAAGNLNAARAADSEIAAGLQAINEVAQNTQSEIDQVESRLDVARATLATTSAELTESDQEQAAIEDQLAAKAVEGFKSGVDENPGVFFTDRSVNQTLRQTQLLQQANRSTAELLEDLRALKEDRRVAQAEAEQATRDAEDLERRLTAELETLQEQQTVQLRLRSEAQGRIARWESELSAYAAEDKEIQRVIASGSSSPPAVATAQPRQPSSLGYQWPVVGKVTSPYGYRVHPVYGTRKLHSGLDVGAARGTPISATSGGVVIFAGRRGGYGNTVMVDHGGGLTSLYAHMSDFGVREGASVNRGDVVGYVGATGTATGNHLHFEIRFGGTPTNPAPYLP